MSTEPYLLQLADRLARGMRSLDDAQKARHRDFLLSQQMPDGGFRGREGGSDLYYTGFAIRGLSMIDGLSPDTCARVAQFTKSHQQSRLSIIDLVSWLYTAVVLQLSVGEDLLKTAAPDWIEQILATLESVRTADGGYAKTTEGAAGSTYHSFLVSLTYELLGRPIPQPERLIEFLHARQRDDGGFVEIAPMKRSGTNPTAAAVALLRSFGAASDALRDDVSGFLGDVWSDEGGFQANTRIIFADGLSTFTGLLTAQDLGIEQSFDLERIERFVTDSLEFPTGGFRAAAWDNQADVEYTFYGLGVLALLRAQ